MIELAKLAYSALGNVFEKQMKTIENQGGKQMKAREKHVKQIMKQSKINKKRKLVAEKISQYF